MWKTIFNPENGLFRPLGKLADFLGLSIAWLLCCLPIVTIGPATTALYYAAAKCVRRGEVGTLINFWDSLKSNFKVSLLAGFPCLGLLGLYAWGYGRLYAGAMAGAAAFQVGFFTYCVAGIFLLGAVGLVCPLISRFPVTVPQALLRSVQMAFRHLPYTLAVGALLFLGEELVNAVPFFIMLVPGIVAWLCTFPLERVLRRYVPEEERLAAEALPREDRPWYLR